MNIHQLVVEGANACMNLANEYAKSGHVVDIVTTWYEGLQLEETLAYDNGEVNIHRIPSKRMRLENCGFPEMLRFLLKALPFCDKLHRKNSFDICQIFFAIPSGSVGYWLKLRYKLPYIIRFGGGDIPGFQERFAFIYTLIGPFEKVLWKHADALVANSKGLQEMALKFYNKKGVLIIPNGANPIKKNNDIRNGNVNNCEQQKESVQENNESKGKLAVNSHDGKGKLLLKILFVSRLISRKGLQDILPELKKLSIPWQLTIVGDGPYRETLETMVSELDLLEHITFVGQKNKQELPEYYSSSDVFILPSHKEGMPNVVLEAMSFGLPIIMTHCEGSDELIDGNGYISATTDFVTHLEEMYNDSLMIEQMGLRSRQLIDTKFKWEMVAKKYLSEMNSILNR